MEEKAVNILVKLEKLLDRAAEKNVDFPEIEDEMDSLEEDVENAKTPGDLKAVMDRAKELGNKVNRRMKKR